ncbi:glutamate racemase [Undibacterium sp. Di26W]|uniref:glutamate racemase n=1 Tax=Undibacterium sp. Di26W TaxID=3413035 RepID=UPI003BF2AB2B
MTHETSAPIGVFDSGIGGLSVLRHIQQTLPNESLLYVADSGFAPYGDKSAVLILERSIAVTEFLLSQQIKALVIACNTATAAAIAHLRLHYPELIIVGMEPGLKPAALLSQTKTVGVLATRSTLQSDKYQRLRTQLSVETGVEFISQACVGLVDQIEKADINSEQIRILLKQYLTPLLDANADTLVLGCTHYPLVADLIRELIPELIPKLMTQHVAGSTAVQLVDTGQAVALHLQRLLVQRGLDMNTDVKPAFTAYASGNIERLQQACAKWLNIAPKDVRMAALNT